MSSPGNEADKVRQKEGDAWDLPALSVQHECVVLTAENERSLDEEIRTFGCLVSASFPDLLHLARAKRIQCHEGWDFVVQMLDQNSKKAVKTTLKLVTVVLIRRGVCVTYPSNRLKPSSKA